MATDFYYFISLLSSRNKRSGWWGGGEQKSIINQATDMSFTWPLKTLLNGHENQWIDNSIRLIFISNFFCSPVKADLTDFVVCSIRRHLSAANGANYSFSIIQKKVFSNVQFHLFTRKSHLSLGFNVGSNFCSIDEKLMKMRFFWEIKEKKWDPDERGQRNKKSHFG